MNKVIKYGSVQANPLYNCSARTPEDWTLKDGVRRPILGISEGIFSILVNILYIPIILVMLEKQNIRISCYKLMTLLAVSDFICIFIDGMLTGVLAYQGAVFCTYPEIIYFSGTIGVGLWCCACMTALILVVNRLMDSIFPRTAEIFFEGNRTTFLLLFPIIYGLYFTFFNTPSLFTSKYHFWFFDPMIFEGKSLEYENIPIDFNNSFVCFFTCFLYICFCFLLKSKTSAGSESRNASIQIFFQSAMICAVNLMVAVIYVCMNYIEVHPMVIMWGQLMWLFGNAAPVFIYLKFNRTIRAGVLKKIGFKKFLKNDKSKNALKSTYISAQSMF